jgi:hypothetical protein
MTASHRLERDFRVLRTDDLALYWLSAPTNELGPKLVPNHVVFSRRTDALDESTTPSSHVLSLTFRERPELVARRVARSRTMRFANERPSLGFHTLRRMKKQAATAAGLA